MRYWVGHEEGKRTRLVLSMRRRTDHPARMFALVLIMRLCPMTLLAMSLLRMSLLMLVMLRCPAPCSLSLPLSMSLWAMLLLLLMLLLIVMLAPGVPRLILRWVLIIPRMLGI